MEVARKFVLFHEIIGEETYCFDRDGLKRICHYPVSDYLKQFCLHKAATFQGRKEAMLTLTNYYQKVPIYIGNGIFYFPVFGYKAKENYWLCFNCIKEVKKHTLGSEVCFSNEFKYQIPVDKRIIVREMERCKEYLILLDEINKFV